MNPVAAPAWETRDLLRSQAPHLPGHDPRPRRLAGARAWGRGWRRAVVPGGAGHGPGGGAGAGAAPSFQAGPGTGRGMMVPHGRAVAPPSAIVVAPQQRVVVTP